MKRCGRLYYRSAGETYPLYEAVPGHPHTVAVSTAISEGTAKIEGEYYQYGFLGTDIAVTLITWKGRKFAMLQRVEYEKSV